MENGLQTSETLRDVKYDIRDYEVLSPNISDV